MKQVNVVVVGCGGISQAWFAGAKALKNVRITGLVDIKKENAEKRREQFGLSSAQVGDDLQTMLKTLQPDAIFDCTIPESHTAVTLEALRQGCHVFGEKPMASNMDDARRMVAAAKKARRIYAVMQNRRMDSRIRAYRKLIASGKLGTLTTLNSDFYIGAHFGGFRDKMKHPLVLDMAIHTFDAARLISGADAVSVFCHEWNPAGSWYAHGASAAAIFEMTNGIVYSYRGSWCSEGLNTTWECDWRAIASKGSAGWNGADDFKAEAVKKNIETFFRPLKQIPAPAHGKNKASGHALTIKHFIESLTAGRAPETVCTDNIKSLAMVFGAIQSAESGKRIMIKS
jgi:predicted dehydrogenase